MELTKDKLIELLKPIELVKVESIKKHEDADRLLIVQIRPGDSHDEEYVEDGLVQIVTAATNFKEGDIVPWLAPGNVVPGWLITNGEEIKLESRKMRGEISHGMILAEDEIGVGNDHEGILVVNQENPKFKIQNPKIGDSIIDLIRDEVLENVINESNKLAGLKSVVEEILGEDDLKKLLASKKQINHYIGFEISGLMHVGQGIMTGLVVRELQKLGVNCRIYLADWHTWINNKLDGDMELIKQVAEDYFTPAMKSAIKIAGGDPEKVEFIFGTELYHHNDRFWQTMVEISKNLTLSRVLKSTTILGREASNSMDFAMLIYPSMQAADIFEMENHVAHAGTDQRNVHVIAREVANKLEINPLKDSEGNKMKPIAIHHGLVSGLNKPAQWPLPKDMDKKEMLTSLKMSKSVKGSAIFLNDSPEEIREKINKAFCPEKEIGFNPVLNWIKMMIFPIVGKFELKREEKFGGDITFDNFEDLEEAYENGEVFPLDLKNNVAETLIKMLEPAYKILSEPKAAEMISKIKEVKKLR